MEWGAQHKPQGTHLSCMLGLMPHMISCGWCADLAAKQCAALLPVTNTPQLSADAPRCLPRLTHSGLPCMLACMCCIYKQTPISDDTLFHCSFCGITPMCWSASLLRACMGCLCGPNAQVLNTRPSCRLRLGSQSNDIQPCFSHAGGHAGLEGGKCEQAESVSSVAQHMTHVAESFPPQR